MRVELFHKVIMDEKIPILLISDSFCRVMWNIFGLFKVGVVVQLRRVTWLVPIKPVISTIKYFFILVFQQRPWWTLLHVELGVQGRSESRWSHVIINAINSLIVETVMMKWDLSLAVKQTYPDCFLFLFVFVIMTVLHLLPLLFIFNIILSVIMDWIFILR